MDIQVKSVKAVSIALTQEEAEEFIIDASAAQERVHELLFPDGQVARKSRKPARSPKGAVPKRARRGPKSGTWICPSCGKMYHKRGNLNRHVAKCGGAATAAAS
jgi:hypothetical protein